MRIKIKTISVILRSKFMIGLGRYYINMINSVCKCYHQTLLSSLAVFWIRIHYNADPDPGLSQTPFESGSINQGVKAKSK